MIVLGIFGRDVSGCAPISLTGARPMPGFVGVGVPPTAPVPSWLLGGPHVGPPREEPEPELELEPEPEPFEGGTPGCPGPL